MNTTHTTETAGGASDAQMEAMLAARRRPMSGEECILAGEPPAEPGLPPHPMQPVHLVRGVARFRENAIVSWMLAQLEARGVSLNEIVRQPFRVDDYEQLMQLIGYSVSGFGDLHRVQERTVNAADREAVRATWPENVPRVGPWEGPHAAFYDVFSGEIAGVHRPSIVKLHALVCEQLAEDGDTGAVELPNIHQVRCEWRRARAGLEQPAWYRARRAERA